MKDYSEYLNKPGMFEFIENSWLTEAKEIHDFHAGVINEVIKKYKIKSVTEWGCGTGNIAARIKIKDYTGIDYNQDCIILAKAKNSKDKVFQVYDVRDAELLRGTVLIGELQFCFGFLKHFGLHEWDEIFKKVCSLGEYLVFNMPIAAETKDDGEEFHHVWKSMKDIMNDIHGNGFDILKIIDHGVEPIFICKRSETII